MKVEMIQHAIGQGGFFTGAIECDGYKFRCVYDCGSNQIRMLRAEIKKAFNYNKHIDTLFLSHFDYDHVNGVEDLLKMCTVGTVVLPYLDDVMKQAIIWRNIAYVGAEEPSSYMNFVLDPVAWIRRLRETRVIQLQGGDGGDPEAEVEDTSVGGEELEPSDELFDTEKVIDPVWVELGESGGWSALQLSDESPMSLAQFIRVPGSIRYWALIPYVHPPCAKCLTKFVSDMHNNFGDAKNILSKLGDPKVRSAIRKTYNRLWPKHNLVSMTLYSGPTNLKSLYYLSGNSVFQKTIYGGFMLTGDANFGEKENRAYSRPCRGCGISINGGRRRDKFLNYYKKYCGHVGALMAPHHGSSKNFSMPFLNFFKNTVVCYASVGTNRYGHPSLDVRQRVHCCSNAYFQTVGNMPRSSLKVVKV